MQFSLAISWGLIGLSWRLWAIHPFLPSWDVIVTSASCLVHEKVQFPNFLTEKWPTICKWSIDDSFLFTAAFLLSLNQKCRHLHESCSKQASCLHLFLYLLSNSMVDYWSSAHRLNAMFFRLVLDSKDRWFRIQVLQNTLWSIRSQLHKQWVVIHVVLFP